MTELSDQEIALRAVARSRKLERKAAAANARADKAEAEATHSKQKLAMLDLKARNVPIQIDSLSDTIRGLKAELAREKSSYQTYRDATQQRAEDLQRARAEAERLAAALAAAGLHAPLVEAIRRGD